MRTIHTMTHDPRADNRRRSFGDKDVATGNRPADHPSGVVQVRVFQPRGPGREIETHGPAHETNMRAVRPCLHPCPRAPPARRGNCRRGAAGTPRPPCQPVGRPGAAAVACGPAERLTPAVPVQRNPRRWRPAARQARIHCFHSPMRRPVAGRGSSCKATHDSVAERSRWSRASPLTPGGQSWRTRLRATR
jgi:hypothetical protein